MTHARRVLALLLAASPWCTPSKAGAQRSRLSGTVIDSLHRAPLSNALVSAIPAGTTRDTVFHATRTDARGHFTLDAMPAGTWTLAVEHPLTDSIGFEVPPLTVRLPSDASDELVLALPSVTTIRRALCPAALADTSVGIMLGTVSRGDGTSLPGARVVFTWVDYVADPVTHMVARQERAASATADSLGIYRACGLPTFVDLFVQAQLGDREQSGVVEEHISDAGVLVRHLMLGAARRDTVTQADSVRAVAVVADGVVTGTVMAGTLPVAGAQVRVFGTDRGTSTNESGRFRFTGLPAGTQGFEVVALGFVPRRFRADVSSSTAPVTVRLDRVAAVLDSVRVTARRQYAGARYSEFDQRLAGGGGRFVTEADIERTHPFVVSDLLRTTSGFGVIIGRDGKATFAANRGVYTLRGALRSSGEHPLTSMGGKSAGGNACPTVYIDGVREPEGDVDRVLPSAVHGIEIYREGEVPAKYGALCGAIFIWTK